MKTFIHYMKVNIEIAKDVELMEKIRNEFLNHKIKSLPDKRCNPDLWEIDKSTFREGNINDDFEKNCFCLSAKIKHK